MRTHGYLSFTALVFFVFFPTFVFAVPRMSMTAGTPCATCHVNPSGSGLRTEVGFDTSRELSLVSVHDLVHGPRAFERSVGQTFESAENELFNHRVSTGLDVRLQWAHLGEPKAVYDASTRNIVEPDMTMFPMQIQPYLKVAVSKTLSVYGSYSMGPNTHKGEACDTVFAGQSCFDATLQYENPQGVTVRTGMIQPTIGMRWDDHTILTRGDAAQRRTPMIPPNYAEWGGEVSYQPMSSIRGELGVFESSNLEAALSAGQGGAAVAAVSYLGRVSYLPHFQIGGSKPSDDDDDEDWDNDDDDDDDEIVEYSPPVNGHIWLSSSVYGSGSFHLISGLLGVGLSNGLAVYSEVSHSIQGDDYTTLNGMFGTSWTMIDSVVPSVRVERAQTNSGSQTTVVEAFVASLEFFPVSFVEIRPEYRIVKTEAFIFGQPTVQLHLYY
jgi:hypothetical protein